MNKLILKINDYAIHFESHISVNSIMKNHFRITIVILYSLI